MNVGEIGEFALIERLKRTLPPAALEPLAIGPGDDAAVWRSGAGYTLATTDTMVEGVHFLDSARAEDVGWKALAVNVSDIGAMGGTPSFALVTLCLPPDTPLAFVDGIYAGVRECAEAFRVTVAGGDIVASPALTITIALLGTAHALEDGSPAVLRRDAARPGDLIAVTGTLGASAAGLRAMKSNTKSAATNALIARHMRPQPRVAAALAAVAAGVRCAIDISDGLVQDLAHICEASGVNAAVHAERLPVDPEVTAQYPDDALPLAATGGEDYELILIGEESQLREAQQHAGVKISIIGEVTPVADGTATVRLLDADGTELQLDRGGWDHFAAPPP